MKNVANSVGGIAVCATLLVSGCASQSGFIKDKQDPAVSSALARGRFDLACPAATANVISSNYLPKAESGDWKGIERAEFTIGVVGCDKKAAYIVTCPDKSDTCQPAQPSGK
jgi:hypothetical protein